MEPKIDNPLNELAKISEYIPNNTEQLAKPAKQTDKGIELVNNDAKYINAENTHQLTSYSNDNNITQRNIHGGSNPNNNASNNSNINAKKISVDLMLAHITALYFISSLSTAKSYYNINNIIQPNQIWLSRLNIEPISQITLNQPGISTLNMAKADVQHPYLFPTNKNMVEYRVSPKILGLNVSDAVVVSPELNTHKFHPNEIVSPGIKSINVSKSDITSPDLSGKNIKYASLMDAHSVGMEFLSRLNAVPAYYNINTSIAVDSTWLSHINLQKIQGTSLNEPGIDVQNTQLVEMQPITITPQGIGIVPYSSPNIETVNLEGGVIDAPTITVNALHTNELIGPNIDAINNNLLNITSPDLSGKNINYASLMDAHSVGMEFLSRLNAVPAYYNINTSIAVDSTWLSHINLQKIQGTSLNEPGIDVQNTQLVEMQPITITPQGIGIVPYSSPNIDTVNLEGGVIDAPSITVNALHTNELIGPNIDAINNNLLNITSPDLSGKNIKYASLMDAHSVGMEFLSRLNAVPAYYNINTSIAVDSTWLSHINLQKIQGTSLNEPGIDVQNTQLVEMQPITITPQGIGIVPYSSPNIETVNLEGGVIDAPSITVNALHTNELIGPNIDAINNNLLNITSPDLSGKNIKYASLMDAHSVGMEFLSRLNAVPAYYNINTSITVDSTWLSHINLQKIQGTSLNEPGIDVQNTQLVEMQPITITPQGFGIVPYSPPNIETVNLEEGVIDAPSITVNALHTNELIGPNIDAINNNLLNITSPDLSGKNINYASLMDAHSVGMEFLSRLNAVPAYYNINTSITVDSTWLSMIGLQHISQLVVGEITLTGIGSQIVDVHPPAVTPSDLNLVDISSPEVNVTNMPTVSIHNPDIDLQMLNSANIASTYINTMPAEYATINAPLLNTYNVGIVNLYDANVQSLLFMSGLNAIANYVNILNTINEDDNWLNKLSWMNVQVSDVKSPEIDIVHYRNAYIEPIIVNALDLNLLPVEIPEVTTINNNIATIVEPRVNQPDKVDLYKALMNGLIYLNNLKCIGSYANMNYNYFNDLEWLSRISVGLKYPLISSPSLIGKNNIIGLNTPPGLDKGKEYLTFKYTRADDNLAYFPVQDYTPYKKLEFQRKKYVLDSDSQFVEDVKRFVMEYVKTNAMPKEWIIVCMPIHKNTIDEHVLEQIWVSNQQVDITP